MSWILSCELGLAYTTGLSRGICSHALLFLMIFLPSSLNSKLLPATGITAHLNEQSKIRDADYLYIDTILSLFENDCRRILQS